MEEKSLDVNMEDKKGVRPLLLAAFNGRLEMFKQLIEKGAELHTSNKQGQTAIKMAQQKNRQEIIQYITEQAKSKNIDSIEDKDMESFSK